MKMITTEEIIELYKKCDAKQNSSKNVRQSINIGTMHNTLNHGMIHNGKSSDVRWSNSAVNSTGI